MMKHKTETHIENNEPPTTNIKAEDGWIEKQTLLSYATDALFRDLTNGSIFTIGDSPIEFVVTEDLGLYTKHVNTVKINNFKCRKFMLIRGSFTNEDSRIYKTIGRWRTPYGVPIASGFIQVKKVEPKKKSKK